MTEEASNVLPEATGPQEPEQTALPDDEKPARGRKPKTLPFRIERDYWDENAVRHRAGTIVEMTAEDALAGMESGAISRVKG